MNKRKTLFSVNVYHYYIRRQPFGLLLQARVRFVIPAVLLLIILIFTVAHQPQPPKPSAAPLPHTSKSGAVPTPALPKTLPSAATTLPALSDMKTCPHGTLLVTVAHQDDDILFMNPALQQSISAGSCVRTVYFTAGDDGNDSSYWLEREQGPLAAYAAMFGVDNQWTSQTSSLNGHPVVSYSLAGVPRVSLIFLRLPDGNVNGQGFATTSSQSLRKLRSGNIASIGSLDGTNTYSRVDLINTIRQLIGLDNPKIIDTQAVSASLAIGDHSDHQAVGYFTTVAAAASAQPLELHRFIGYQAGSMTPNLDDDQISAKLNIFSAYEQYDPMVCNADAGCFNSFVYLRYISRQYEQANPGL